MNIGTKELSFAEIKTKRQKRYDLILDRLDKPKTAKELAVELYNLNLIPSSERNYTAPRLTELEELGIVKVIGKVKCSYTGKMVAVYSKVEESKEITEDYLGYKQIKFY